MLHIILFQPEIPQNTGNIGRLCAFTRSRLHLIRPLGFEISDKHLKRSGMDYWKDLDLHIHEDWNAFRALPEDEAPSRLWLLTTKTERLHWNVEFQNGDGLVFGNEGHGAPQWLHDEMLPDHRITLKCYDDALRSLNLSTAVGIAAYEALRQIG
ncbi:MAG: tRNA (cytidine(34)-2'-O)-methyltransferase [Opitutales bacterium]|nr:tRNA (cytidine(34)-2'-O)-methyltransferase [Opitutales bacterium]